MEPGSIAAIITAISTLVAAIGAFIVSWRAAKVQTQKLDEIHVMVNSRLTEALAEIVELKAAIK